MNLQEKNALSLQHPKIVSSKAAKPIWLQATIYHIDSAALLLLTSHHTSGEPGLFLPGKDELENPGLVWG